MTAKDILKLRDLGEVSKVQFKERLLDKYDIGCEIVAFSNTHGGQLIVGINDKTGVAINGRCIPDAQNPQTGCRVSWVFFLGTFGVSYNFFILAITRKSNHTACAYHCWIYFLCCVCSWYFPGYRYMDLESGRGYYDPDRQDQCRW